MERKDMAVIDAALFRITEGRHPDEARVFFIREDANEEGIACCDLCGEPEPDCECGSDYSREHDTGAER